MEESRRRRRRRRSVKDCSRKRRITSSASATLRLADLDTLFSLLLAALSKAQALPGPRFTHLSLVKKCLRRLRLAVLSDWENPTLPCSQHGLPVPVLSLLPVIIKSRFLDVASLGLEVVGTAALRSLEMNEQIALDSEIVSGLIWVLSSSSRKLKTAACSVMLDLCSSSVGREKLLASSALESLINCFLQVPESLWGTLILCTEEDGVTNTHVIVSMEEEYIVILLDAIIVLVNSCCKEQLEDIPIQSLDSFLVILKTAWMHLSSRMLVKVLDSNKTGKYFSANSRVKDLAECIFRLSINDKCANLVPSEDIRRRIFRSHDGSLENFLISHWETTPLLVDSLRAANGDDCFRPFLHYLNWDGALPHSMTCMLQNMFSCPPIASDELDILNYLKQEKDKFALPILYQQDIRVLKVDRKLNTEKHFFPEGPDSCSQIPYILSCNDIVKCEEALEKGFTLAIRGMEFRFKSVAAITEELASLFGLPSVGANLYLTPPNSQGLARHYDDHCVFVCQLVGSKQWKISPPQSKLLPRLYEQISGACLSPTSDGKNSCMQITLKEGDLLYIPRGFIHEAYTNDGEFSLHLTLAIEVEAPFEWEGFMHAALSCWSLKNIKRVIIEDPLSENLDFMSIKLLHVTIGLLGDSDKIFRKACLVGSLSWSSHLSDWLEQNQRTTFSQLVEKIDKSKFTEVLKALDMVVQQNDDLFQRLAWIRVFYPEEGTFGGLNERKFDVTAEDILALCYKDREKSETAFTDLKSRFCKEIEFQQGISGYSLVLEKYKKVRKQYLNGMLSMHCKFK